MAIQDFVIILFHLLCQRKNPKLWVFTYTDNGLFQVMLGQVRVNECPAGLDPPAVARNGMKTTLKIRRNPPLRILPLIPPFIIMLYPIPIAIFRFYIYDYITRIANIIPLNQKRFQAIFNVTKTKKDQKFYPCFTISSDDLCYGMILLVVAVLQLDSHPEQNQRPDLAQVLRPNPFIESHYIADNQFFYCTTFSRI